MSDKDMAFVLDMDGVLYHGEQVLDGAVAFMDRISAHAHVFLTNNPALPPGRVADRLERLGFSRPDERLVVTSAEATASWLAREKPGFRYFAVGADGLDAALRQQGRADEADADFVVVGEGPGLDFQSLTTGINLVLGKGARLVATNPDTTVDATRDGQHVVLPGGGALVASFVAATGRQPVVIGKPEPLLFDLAMARIGMEPKRCIMIGDRPDTDIAGAARAGMRTALVRTGRFGPGEDYPPDLPAPDWDAVSLQELAGQLEAAGII
jgi:4-nitrophenyl phosphatase/NagD protein